MAEKKYGHFDDANREYVITDPKTPWPWINYLGNEDFFLPRGLQGECRNFLPQQSMGHHW